MIMNYRHFDSLWKMILAGVFLAFVTSYVSGDSIVLSNGDRVTGQVTDSTDGKMTVKSELMGDVVIDIKDIVSIETDEPLPTTFADGEKVVGKIATEGEQVKITRDNQSQVTRTLSALEGIRDADNQQAYERELERQRNPGWLDFWSIEAELGVAAAKGNADTTTINSGALVRRTTGFDRTTLVFEQIYSTQRTTEAFGTIANAISGGVRYERNISTGLFVYTGASFDIDEFQDLDLRTVLGGGLGWHVIRSDRHTWDVGGGGNWNREKFSTGLLRNSGEVNFYEESDHKLTRALRAYHGFYFFPNLSERGEYRFRVRAGVDFNLNSHLALTIVLSDKFLSNPLPGNKRNDLMYSTGIQFRWAQD